MPGLSWRRPDCRQRKVEREPGSHRNTTITERKSDGRKSSERRFLVLSILSIWKGKRRKLSDKVKGTAELIGELSMNFTGIMRLLAQK